MPISVVPKGAVEKFMKSKITINLDKKQMPNNVLKGKVTFETPDHKTIRNTIIKHFVNDKPAGEGPVINVPVIPKTNSVVLRVVVKVPNVGSKTKIIVLPVKNGKIFIPVREFSLPDYFKFEDTGCYSKAFSVQLP